MFATAAGLSSSCACAGRLYDKQPVAASACICCWCALTLCQRCHPRFNMQRVATVPASLLPYAQAAPAPLAMQHTADAASACICCWRAIKLRRHHCLPCNTQPVAAVAASARAEPVCSTAAVVLHVLLTAVLVMGWCHSHTGLVVACATGQLCKTAAGRAQHQKQHKHVAAVQETAT